MKFKILLILLVLTGLLSAQNIKKVKVYFINNNELANILKSGIDIEYYSIKKDKYVIAFTDDSQFEVLKSKGFRYDVLIENWEEYYKKQSKLSKSEKEQTLLRIKTTRNITGFDYGSMGGFYTWQEILDNLDTMYAKYPNIMTEKFSIGQTYEGREMYVVKISDNPNINEEEPEVFYNSLIHSREPAAMMALMYYMYYLLENYGSDPEVTYLVNNRQIYFLPVFNVDGYEYNRRNHPSGGGIWRKNRHLNSDGTYGVDLNRNYGYKWGHDDIASSPIPSSDIYRGTAPFSEPETNNVRNFIKQHNFKTALNYHTLGNLVILPWGYTAEEVPDSILYREYGADMTQYNKYTWGIYDEIIYSVNGGADDWMYGEQSEKNKIFSVTVEVGRGSDGSWPPESRIFPLVEENLFPNLYLTWVAGGFITSIENKFDKEYYLPGESGKISTTFKNKGLSEIKNVTAELTSMSNYIEITKDKVEINKLESQATTLFQDAFEFNISNNAPLGEEFKCLLTTYHNGTPMYSENISFILGIPTMLFEDTADSLGIRWISQSNIWQKWEPTKYDHYSSPSSFTDSKYGSYFTNSELTLTTTEQIDCTNIPGPYLSFQTKYEIESGWDYGQVLISTDNGISWNAVGGRFSKKGLGPFQPNELVYDGKQKDWVKEIINLSEFGGDKILLRFKFKTDDSEVRDGWYVDDICMFYYSGNNSANDNTNNLYKYDLRQNYPNPFNPVTTISFSLPKKEYVKLTITDISGRLVKTLINSTQHAGKHTVRFDGSDMASGIYLYTLKTQDKVITKKLTLLK